MKKPSYLLLIGMITIIMLLMAACGGGKPATVAPTSPPAVESNEEPAEEQPAEEEPAAEEQPAEEEPAEEEPMEEGITLDANGVPSDVPYPDTAYDLRVEANHTRISFKIDGSLQDVVAFFQAELPGRGWGTTLGMDSAVGSMGTIGRQNDVLDKLSINMSFNPNGNFVNITVDIIRAP